MENLEGISEVATDDSIPTEQIQEESKELSNEEMQAEIDSMKEEIKTVQDPKEKRHKEQDVGRKMEILKQTQKAKELREANIVAEKNLIDEVYEKATTDWFGLEYFEKIYKTKPELADKVAQEKWGKKNAKEIILKYKKEFAEDWDETAEQELNEYSIRENEREKIMQELATEKLEELLDEFDKEDRKLIKEEFDDIIEWKKLTPQNVKKYVDMAKSYVLWNKPISQKEKDRIIAKQASTGIWWRTWEVESFNKAKALETVRELKNSWISESHIKRMYPELYK